MAGLSDDDLTQVETLAKNVFNVPEAKADPPRTPSRCARRQAR